MKKSFLSLAAIAGLTFTLNQSVSAQETGVSSKAFYTELGGPGVLMSANFDARFNPNDRLGFGFRLGAGFGYGEFEGKQVVTQWGTTYYETVTKTYYSIPAGLNYIFGKPNSAHAFEVGAGLTLLTRKVALYYYGREEESAGNMMGFLTFMYRIMPENGGFSFRIGLTPIIGTGGELFPSGAIGFGYVF